ncbi:RNA pyrophosphohydrolase [Telmatospirillum siberiense]|uniref:RNA pyrophosphohydrolase n=1 Tax=Telmatospirillum siberiense TaxID=382514 RepID=A0A2N3PYG1_9PROT|nr:RNA pyrophosphohydrolase [Telmatospirillum siberiense]PKU25433.1 RNA pyrophosphohydrolase [Telmatospirillum siberiense]
MSDAADHTTLPYRPCVGLMLFNAQGLVFTAKRIDTDIDAWQMPQGGIDAGESPRQAAFREMKEEIGTDSAEILGESADWLRYDLPADLVGKVWKGRFRGQEQKWFALRFTGRDCDIDIRTEHPEFCDWRWSRFDQLPDLVVPFKRDLYRAIVREFTPIASDLAVSAATRSNTGTI